MPRFRCPRFDPGRRLAAHLAKVDNPGDHHFVLLNRNVSVPIGDTARWVDDPDVIVCDPWWFIDDGGDAHLFTSRKAKDLRQEILDNKAGLAVDLALPLGTGHSARFGTKHGGTDYGTT